MKMFGDDIDSLRIASGTIFNEVIIMIHVCGISHYTYNLSLLRTTLESVWVSAAKLLIKCSYELAPWMVLVPLELSFTCISQCNTL